MLKKRALHYLYVLRWPPVDEFNTKARSASVCFGTAAAVTGRTPCRKGVCVSGGFLSHRLADQNESRVSRVCSR